MTSTIEHSGLDTPFEVMGSHFRLRWLRWAQSHDWGERCRYVVSGGFRMAVTCDFRDECGDWGTEIIYVSTPRELRDLAGY